MPLIDVRALHLSIPTGHIIQKKKVILDDVSFSVEQGSCTAYLGTNGAGKTSTFRVLCGLVAADSGSVYFDGERMQQGLPPQRFGFMPEHPYFYKNLTPHELLMGLGRLSGIATHNLSKRIEQWSERLDFARVLHQRLSTCSKGQVQRVGLTQALIHEPDFVLLDEPLSGLDPIGRACVRQVIQDEIQRGATLLFSSHILSDAEAICDRVVVLQQGHVRYSGDIHALLAQQSSWLIQARGDVSWSPEEQGVQMTQSLDGTWQWRGNDAALRIQCLQHILATPHMELISVTPEQRSLEDAFLDLLNSKENHDASHS